MILLREYGVQSTINFDLFQVDGIDFRIDAVYTAGDVKIMKDEGAENNTTNAFSDEGLAYSHVITAAELQAKRVKLYYIDQDATKVWLDRSVTIETYGHPLSQHPDRSPELILSTTIATLASQVSFTLAGGSVDNDPYNDAMVIITDATTNTQKAIGIMSDYVGGTKTVTLASDPAIFTMTVGDYVDVIVTPKIIKTVTANTDMRGTDSANTVVPDAAGVAPTAVQVRQEMDSNSTGLAKLGTPAADVSADIAAIEAKTSIMPTAAQWAKINENAGDVLKIVFSSGSTTTGVISTVDGISPSFNKDSDINNRVLVFTDDSPTTLKHVVTDITAFNQATNTVTFTGIPTAVSTHTARLY